MASRPLRRLAVTALAATGLLLGIAALLLLTRSAQSPSDFNRLNSVTLTLNVLGVVLLFALLAGNVNRLLRELRRSEPGSKLKLRMVSMFIGLAVLPLLLVYYFSVQFLNRGIDSWFDSETETGLVNALELSQAILEIQMAANLSAAEDLALDLFGLPDRSLFRVLARERAALGATEITIFTDNRSIIATNSIAAFDGVPRPVESEVVLQTRQGEPYVYFDPLSFEVRTAVPINSSQTGRPERILRATFRVPARIASRLEAVEKTFTDYQQLKYLREPLKRTLTLTLTVILLVSLLLAIYGAFFFSRRLVAPIQQLVAGTRAVAAGDFDTRLPTPSRDEIGVLVSSFNDMTRRLAVARETARQSQALVESERQNLEVILARLSTGVVSLEPDLKIRTANQSAGAILDVDLESMVGKSLDEAAKGHPLLQQFADAASVHLAAGEREWREQIVLRGEVGRRILTCGCSALPFEDDLPSGYVVVFDDITALLQAQRDAAWGEVARRLAHEIKNPLTPIQLSAERMRRKYLSNMAEADAQVLDRATHTIVQQVEAMKEMVNAFSEYARAPDMDMSSLNLNQLIQEVADLYRSQEETSVAIGLELSDRIPEIYADAGRIRQILHNLIRNAIEAIDADTDGHIRVRTQLQNVSGVTMASIVVSDNGPGFKSERVEQVFDPYVTSKPKGTGLGLAIVKKLVEEHAGTIAAANGEFGGAEITLNLPIDEAAREAMLARAPRRGQALENEKRRVKA